jgi:hypothetical protein
MAASCSTRSIIAPDCTAGECAFHIVVFSPAKLGIELQSLLETFHNQFAEFSTLLNEAHSHFVELTRVLDVEYAMYNAHVELKSFALAAKKSKYKKILFLMKNGNTAMDILCDPDSTAMTDRFLKAVL